MVKYLEGASAIPLADQQRTRAPAPSCSGLMLSDEPIDELEARRSRRAEAQAPEAITDADGRVIGGSTGTVRIEIPAVNPDLKWPSPEPGNVPACLVPLPPLPTAIPAGFGRAGFSRWVRLLGGHGHIHHGLVRAEDGRVTVVGEGMIDLVDPSTLDPELDAAEASSAADQRQMFGDRPMPVLHAVHFRCWDAGWRRRVPFEVAGGADRLHVRELDGDPLRWHVLRARTR
jgi:hypothetical protein